MILMLSSLALACGGGRGPTILPADNTGGQPEDVAIRIGPLGCDEVEVEVAIDGGPLERHVGTQGWVVIRPEAWADGSHTVEVRAVDGSRIGSTAFSVEEGLRAEPVVPPALDVEATYVYSDMEVEGWSLVVRAEARAPGLPPDGVVAMLATREGEPEGYAHALGEQLLEGGSLRLNGGGFGGEPEGTVCVDAVAIGTGGDVLTDEVCLEPGIEEPVGCSTIALAPSGLAALLGLLLAGRRRQPTSGSRPG